MKNPPYKTPGFGPKKLRKAVRGDIENWRYARAMRKAYEDGGHSAVNATMRDFNFRFQPKG